MPDDPRPLSPEEVDTLERSLRAGEFPLITSLQWLATVRDRERQRDEAQDTAVKISKDRAQNQTGARRTPAPTCRAEMEDRPEWFPKGK